MKKTAIDKVIEVNEAKIRELTAVNDALRAVQTDKRKKKATKPEHTKGALHVAQG